jgi:hypothetical protein
MSTRARLSWLFVLAALSPAGACNAGSKCLRSSDCPTGYVCGEGQCELRSRPALDASFDANDGAAGSAGASGSAGSSALDAGADAHAGSAGSGGAAGEAGATNDSDASALDSGTNDSGFPDAGDASAPDAF